MHNEMQDTGTTRSEKIVREEGISWRGLPPITLLAALGAAVTNAIIYFAASRLGFISPGY